MELKYCYPGDGSVKYKTGPRQFPTAPAKIEKLIVKLKPKVSHLVLVYSQDEAIEGGVNAIISNLDELIWTAPGPRHIVGAIHNQDITLPHRGVILEYDGVETIRLWLSEIE